MGPASSSVPILETVPPVAGSQLDVIKTQICEAVANEPAVLGRLADQLRCEDLITPSVQKAVKCVDGKYPYDKADAMISPAIEHVQNDPEGKAPALVKAMTSVGLGSLTTISCLREAGKL